jgi:hypothetical protein
MAGTGKLSSSRVISSILLFIPTLADISLFKRYKFFALRND